MSWRAPLPQVWTQNQRSVLIAFLLIMTIWLSLRLWRDSATVPEELPAIGPRAGELMSRLDLNTATAAALSAIPHLGEKKAADIIAYREQYISEHAGHRAFERMEDLYHIKGIGTATLEQMREFLFITGQATTKS